MLVWCSRCGGRAVRGARVSELWRRRVWRFASCSLAERRRCRRSTLVCRFLSFWFGVCAALGSPVGSLLARPFFVSLVPPCWVRSSGRWVRRWAPRSCGRPSAASGFSGSWVCVSPSALPALRLSCFVWFLCPAVVARCGLVFRVWAFVSPAPPGAGATATRKEVTI